MSHARNEKMIEEANVISEGRQRKHPHYFLRFQTMEPEDSRIRNWLHHKEVV